MARTIRLLATFGGGAFLVSFAVLIVNQTAQVVQLATTIHPTLGTVTLCGLVTTYAALVGVPVVMVLRLPRPLSPPARDEGREFDLHLRRLAERLAPSPHLAGHDLSDRRGIEVALRILDEKATAIAREAASGVFLATAVSQSGRLDGLVVLAAQSRMVWRVARVYQQRPTLRDMVHLYANVAGTAFVAGELQEIDLGEQGEASLSSAVGALGASVPGFHVAGTILANCVLSGSANAFLTLRVGMIARRYCGALVVEPKSAVRKAATTEAAGHLGGIVAEGSSRLTKALWRASADKVGGAVLGVGGDARGAGGRVSGGGGGQGGGGGRGRGGVCRGGGRAIRGEGAGPGCRGGLIGRSIRGRLRPAAGSPPRRLPRFARPGRHSAGEMLVSWCPATHPPRSS